MSVIRRTLSMVLAAVICLCMVPAVSFAAPVADFGMGNSDLNIRNGGVMLSDGEDFYFTSGGIFVQKGKSVTALSAHDGKNLNLWEGYIYYTLGNRVLKLPAGGGESELVHAADSEIKQLYVVNGALRYLGGGRVYNYVPGEKTAEKVSELDNISGLIPTAYGDILLTGEVFDYTLYAGGKALLSGVESCYTDEGYLALSIGGKNYMVSLQRLFEGFSRENDLEDFSIHGTVSALDVLSPDDENTISEFNDNNELMMDFAALLREAGLDTGAELMAIDPITGAEIPDSQPSEVTEPLIPPVSQGQINIVKRARQLHEIEWTPLEDRYQWGYQGVFKAETTYTGLPYGQPVNSAGYVGYNVSLNTFASSVLDNTSKFYTSYSTYNKVAPVYSTDCSGFVSYAWQLPVRCTTYSIPKYAELVGDQSLYSIQVGDCLNKTTSHVVLISSITYDDGGNIIGLEVMEQTPVVTRLTKYGQGQSRSLASFQSYYLNGGYAIYRNPSRDNVTYTPSPLVPLDGEYVDGMKEKAPKSHTTGFVGGKTVELSSDKPGAAIYYTLDGSAPTDRSNRYTGPISFYQATKLRAIAVTGDYPDSTILEYTVKIPPADTPKVEIVSGMNSGNLVSSGSTIKLSSTAGATIYYTLDGSEPTSSSSIYSAPIAINANTTIKAIAEKAGYTRSATSTQSYKLGQVYTLSTSAGQGGSISPAGNTKILETGSATVEIKPDSGYTIKDVVVDGVSVGAVKSYSFSNISSNHSVSASFVIDANIPFTDVISGSWYYDAVSFAYANKLFNGTSGTAFSPDMQMTRGMFVTVLGRFAGLPSNLSANIGIVTGVGVNIRKGPSTDTEVVGFVSNKNTVVQVLGKEGDWYKVSYATATGYIRNDLIKVYEGNYSDLPADQYYSVYAQWAYVSGVASGTAGSTFNANDNISREHMCLMLYNYAKLYGISIPKNVDKITFSDDASISASAKDAVYALQQAGVINGMGNGGFSPQGTATRAQVAQMYMKYVQSVK